MKRRWATNFMIFCLLLASHSAISAPVEGCSTEVMTALKAKAKAKMAYDKAVTEQVVDRPDSVLAMTCFNESAGMAASKAGQTFSGDFVSESQNLTSSGMSDAYVEDSGGQPATASSTLQGSANCNGMDDAWKELKEEGIEGESPVASLTDMTDGVPPAGAGDDFTTSWNAAKDKGVFDDLKNAVTALPDPTAQATDYSVAGSSCDVLAAAGIVSGGCQGVFSQGGSP